MTTRTITTAVERDMLVKFISQHELPMTVTVEKGRRRSVEQNRLQRKWIAEIAEQSGHTHEEVRALIKLTIGVPILRRENEAFRLKYDEAVKPLSYEQKIALMGEPLDMPVTRLMTVKMHTEFLDTIYRDFAEKGYQLTSPEHG